MKQHLSVTSRISSESPWTISTTTSSDRRGAGPGGSGAASRLRRALVWAHILDPGCQAWIPEFSTGLAYRRFLTAWLCPMPVRRGHHQLPQGRGQRRMNPSLGPGTTQVANRLPYGCQLL